MPTAKTVFAMMSVVAATFAPGAAASADTDFQSPSGNIACHMDHDLGAVCDIASYTYAVPPHPADCPLHFGDRFMLSPGKAPVMVCHGDTVRVAGEQTLNYGQRLSVDSISCDSEPAGMTCTDAHTGHYFQVASGSFELH